MTRLCTRWLIVSDEASWPAEISKVVTKPYQQPFKPSAETDYRALLQVKLLFPKRRPDRNYTSVNMADDAAAGGAKKRTFRKFTFRGVDLDQLLDMSTDELVDLFHARARRKFQRGLKRKPLALIKKLRAAKKQAESGEKPEPVRTHLRNMIIVPEMIGSIVGVYNGKTFNQASFKPQAYIPLLLACCCHATSCAWFSSKAVLFTQVEIKPDMVGHYLAEFSISYKPVKHGKPGIGATHSSRFIPLK